MADTKITALADAGGATAADYLYIVDGATSKHVQFDDFEGSLTHDNVVAGTIASHDTTATGTELDTLTDGSDASALHEHATLTMADDTTDAFSVQEGANHYICVNTDNGSESVVFGCGAVPTIMTIEPTLISTEVDLDVDGDIVVSGTVDGVDIATDVAANTLKDTNVDTDLSVTKNATTMTVVSSDGDNAVLVEADTTNAGILGSDKWDEIVANSNKATNVSTNITIVEAPTNVDVQSSDGSNDTIAAANVTNAGVMTTTMYDEHVVNTAHAIDNTQAHSDYLLNSGADVAVGPLTTTADNSTADQAFIPMILYNTDDTPPAASGFPVGTLYVQYTA